PMATIVDWTAVGADPEVMGIGSVPEVKELLERTGKQKEDVGVWELTEAFASQSLAVIRELGLLEDVVIRSGAAIALGPPPGATYARITTSLLYEMKRKEELLGVATLCVGGGQGMALMLAR